MGRMWHHLVAAVVGLVLAGLMVFFVFGSADEEGAAQDGEAPAEVAEDQDAAAGGGDCGSVQPAAARSAATRRMARNSMPAIIDAAGREVTLTDNRQTGFVAGIHAALGLCAVEVTIRPNENPSVIEAVAAFPEDVAIDAVSGYAMQTLTSAFTSDVFAIEEVRLSLDHAGEQRDLFVSRRVWETFRNQRQNLSLPDSVTGLTRLDERIGYGASEFDVSGW